MKIKNNIPDGLKSFCETVWIFSGVLIGLMALYSLGDGGAMGCDLLATVLGLLLPFGCVLSVVWLVVTLVWCIVIVKNEKNKSIFLKPAVVVTNLINIFNFIWLYNLLF